MPNQQSNLEQQNKENKLQRTNWKSDKMFRILGVVLLGIILLNLADAILPFLTMCPELLFENKGFLLVQIISFMLLVILVAFYITFISLRLRRLGKVDKIIIVANLIILLLFILIYPWSWAGSALFNKTSPSCLGPEVNLQDETANWQTYRNEKYGFEIKIPIDWSVKEYDNGVNFASKETQEMVKQNEENCSAVPPHDCAPDLPGSDFSFNIIDPSYYDSEEFTSINVANINGINFLRYVEKASLASPVGYGIEKDGKGFDFKLLVGDENLLRQVLSTFKFIEQTANWQTYRNDEYRFETKYPTIYNVKIDSNETGFFLARFENQQYIAYYKISVTENTKNPKYSNFVSNPECYERIREDNYNDVDWTLNWWQCSSGGDKNPIAAYTIKGNYVFEVLLDSDSRNSSIEKINQILSTFKFTL